MHLHRAEVCNTYATISVLHIDCREVIGCPACLIQTAEMASASFYYLVNPAGLPSRIFITADSLAIAGSTLTVFCTFHQINVARHLQKKLKKDKRNRNTLEENRVSNTANRFHPGQILAANLLILHTALWAIVRSTLHLTFTIKQVRNPDAWYLHKGFEYPMVWTIERSDMKHLGGVIQTFTWGTLLFTAMPMFWMVRQFFPKAFLPRARTLSLLFGSTASYGVSFAMLAWVNLIMVSLLSSMLEIQRHATRAKVQGRDVPLTNGQWGRKRCAKVNLSLLEVF
ncbi:hypothetical protein B0T13DRAFT_490814 [Neurospora crassa]|nr:hypothetical protein B0T13DRAFT_490814 [Neurospora crassa]